MDGYSVPAGVSWERWRAERRVAGWGESRQWGDPTAVGVWTERERRRGRRGSRQSAVVGPASLSAIRDRRRPCRYAPANIPATAQRMGQLPMPTLA